MQKNIFQLRFLLEYVKRFEQSCIKRLDGLSSAVSEGMKYSGKLHQDLHQRLNELEESTVSDAATPQEERIPSLRGQTGRQLRDGCNERIVHARRLSETADQLRFLFEYVKRFEQSCM